MKFEKVKSEGLRHEYDVVISAEDIENGIVEDKETIEARNQEYIKTEMEKLGSNAVEVITKNVQFVNNDNRFNEAEKEALLNFLDMGGAVAVTAINKFRLGAGESITFTNCKHNAHDSRITTNGTRPAGYAIEDSMMEAIDGSINLFNASLIASST